MEKLIVIHMKIKTDGYLSMTTREYIDNVMREEEMQQCERERKITIVCNTMILIMQAILVIFFFLIMISIIVKVGLVTCRFIWSL